VDKKIFEKTEWKLYRYFEKDKKIKSLDNKIRLLESHIKLINEKIKNMDISIPIESRSISFDEKVQVSNDGTSYVERTMINIIDRLEREIINNKDEIIKLEELIRKIKEDNKMLDDYIIYLNNDYKNFLEYKYRDKLKNWQIANKLNISEVTCTRIKRELINDISRWENSFLI
jgi:DNA-directed RNA polymerase specialized sigma subunit